MKKINITYKAARTDYQLSFCTVLCKIKVMFLMSLEDYAELDMSILWGWIVPFLQAIVLIGYLLISPLAIIYKVTKSLYRSGANLKLLMTPGSKHQFEAEGKYRALRAYRKYMKGLRDENN